MEEYLEELFADACICSIEHTDFGGIDPQHLPDVKDECLHKF